MRIIAMPPHVIMFATIIARSRGFFCSVIVVLTLFVQITSLVFAASNISDLLGTE